MLKKITIFILILSITGNNFATQQNCHAAETTAYRDGVVTGSLTSVVLLTFAHLFKHIRCQSKRIEKLNETLKRKEEEEKEICEIVNQSNNERHSRNAVEKVENLSEEEKKLLYNRIKIIEAEARKEKEEKRK